MLRGVVYQAADGTVTSMNPAAEHILGKSLAEFQGQTSVSVQHHTLTENGDPFPVLEHPSMVALRTGQLARDVLMQVYNPREQQYCLIVINAVPPVPRWRDDPLTKSIPFSTTSPNAAKPKEPCKTRSGCKTKSPKLPLLFPA
ncbi:MAG: hypothetical protein IPK53_03910 [bacterium]|nr:hypothetical protein [bacterium]